jgi:very-short-patch-repair endonuclease
MNDRVDQVHAVLRTLERELDRFDGTLAPIEAAQIIQGLFNKRSPSASRIRALVGSKVTVSPGSAQGASNILSLASVMLIDGMTLPASVSAAYDGAITRECARASNPKVQWSRCKSRFELKIVKRLGALCLSHKFQANVHAVDGLEMDLYFPVLKLNIELDGPYHRMRATRLLNTRRDDHLQRKGIQVHRINILDYSASSAVEEILEVLSSFGVERST